MKLTDSIIKLEEDDANSLQFECTTNKDFNGKVQWFKNDKTVSLIDASLFKVDKVVEKSSFVYKLFAYKPKTSRLIKTVDFNYLEGTYYALFNSTIKSDSIEIKVNKAPPNEFTEHLSYKILNSKSNEIITQHSNIIIKCSTFRV